MTTTGDGIVSALQILRIMCETGKSLAELKAGMNKFPQVLINVPISQPIDIAKNSTIQSAINEAEEQLGKRGRILLRVSGTEPVIRVMVEGENQTEVNSVAKELVGAVQSVAGS